MRLWPLHTPFVIARGSRSEAKVVVVELEEDGVKGIGECTPYPRYGESIASVMAQVMAIGEQLEAGLTREQLQRLLPAGAARNAIDCALWDLQARREGKTLAQLLGVALPDRVITAQTVVIGTPDQMAASAAALWQAGAQLLKVKLDDRLISERLIAIRQAAPEATLIVDANESGTARGWRRAVSCWRTSVWRCLSSRSPPTTTRRWKTSFIRCRFAPTRAATPGRACRGCAGAMRWSISNWIKRAA